MPDTPLWIPDDDRVANAAMTRFRRDAETVAGRSLPDYDALHAWSVDAPDAFWSLLADRWIAWREPPARVRSDDPLPFVRWFEGGTANVVDRLLWPDGVQDHDVAIIASAEGCPTRRWTFADLRAEVASIQAGFRAAGLVAGDAVAAYAANVPEAVAALMACAADGLVFTSGSPDFGADAAAARFAQLRPKALLASPASRYGGRRHDAGETVGALAAALPSATLRVALPVPGEPDAPVPRGFESWRSWTGRQPAGSAPTTRALPFDHPIYVLYSSGTTGTPKAIRHRAGGALLSQWKELGLHCDVRTGDRVLYYTTTGWMMWNWLVAALGVGAAIVLVDGSPAHPDPLRLWRLARDEEVTFFGTSARFLHGLASAGARPGELGLPRLRTVASTGSPLSEAGFRYVYEHVASDVHLASISGGTDIVSCFLAGVPTLPVYAGQLQRPGLGVDLAVMDQEGRELDGGPGELVCRSDLPSMPLGFVGDADGSRYRATYAARVPGAWTHGDRIERTAQGGYRHHGRSDATLNPGGVRIGSAEVTGPVLALPEVADAVAVARRSEHDEEIWLLIVPADGTGANGADLEARLRATIRRCASPRHVPATVLLVPDLPRTRSGKTMELAIAEVVNGRWPSNTDSAANPGAFAGIAERIREP
ncbi:MAG: acetoacetate--CoA ligase [Trueperaceae bacterium]|nr:acetoacetate--CoA ligase [Trueperaceae bacterium]